ncbi:MAG: RNA methyltransferase [Betaproteobacteria bacterium]|nr:RNA methyltransferase [Betaproteobacteria bacterium]
MLLDGVHLVEACEQAGGLVETLIVATSALDGGEIARFVAGREITIVADALMRELGLVESPSGLVAIAALPAPVAVDPQKDAILLDGVQDPGNVGTLLRTAAAAGVKQAILGPGCAAAWSPKVLRAGQGAHFVMNVVEDADLATFLADFRGTSVATTLGGDAGSLYAAELAGPLAWIFGSEGQGVRPELLAGASQRVHIPMPGAVESLNVAAAAAVCLFEMVRRRSA